MTRDATDAELIALCRTGDTGAFNTLVKRYQALAASIAYGLLQDKERAEDVVQESFVSAWKALGGFREDAEFRNWLCRIVLNKARSALRWSAIRRFIRLDAPKPEGDEAYLDDLRDMTPEGDVEAATLKRERAVAVRRAVARLPVQQRTAVLLRANGLSVEEAAKTMGVAAGTVKAHLHQARKKLEEGGLGA